MSKDIKKDANNRTLSNTTEKNDSARDDDSRDQNRSSGVQEESEAAKERDRLSAWLEEQREEHTKLKHILPNTTEKREEGRSMPKHEKQARQETKSSKPKAPQSSTKNDWPDWFRENAEPEALAYLDKHCRPDPNPPKGIRARMRFSEPA